MTPEILNDLRKILEKGLASGSLNQAEIDRQTKLFQRHFGPEILRDLDGEALLKVMHGRADGEPRCMVSWLEFKNDEEFSCKLFGSIAGGSALKFGLYDKKGVWLTGAANAQHPISVDQAIELARGQRGQLISGCEVLASFDPGTADDASSAAMDTAMKAAAPTLWAAGWAHKYWSLIYPDRLDIYHTPQYQRFHLLKLLEVPPDHVGVLSADASRFVCAARFLNVARQLDVSMTVMCKVLGMRSPFHRYWKVGTTAGSTGESQWAAMHSGGLVSIGWKEHVPDLSSLLKEKDLKSRIAALLEGDYQDAGTRTRKAGEITNFAREIAPGDLVLACNGATVLGIGRVTGPYEYKPELVFPHTRAVEWLSASSWTPPTTEGPRTTVYAFGRDPQNVLQLEQKLSAAPLEDVPVARPSTTSEGQPLAPLDPWSARAEASLKRKGQVILYGPPGTGKTYRGLALAKELASRQAFGKTHSQLAPAERESLAGGAGLVQICTFHPNWGYEDFMEGIRAHAEKGVVSFADRDGIFKCLCDKARKSPERHFYLIIDEINRGDIPRIFGELMTVLEMDKRHIPITLPITGKDFNIPRNVFIVGTMNTADRSISLLDAALRRRFSFIELMPDSRWLAGTQLGEFSLGVWLDALNDRLRKCLKRDARNLQVGHAYLMPSPSITTVAEFSRILRDDIIPLLEEYCYDDFATLGKILGTDLVDVERGRINEDLFDQSCEAELIQAIAFEEMADYAIQRAAESINDVGGDEAEDDTRADSELSDEHGAS
ncbi:McrB family protein [Ramlibacter sp. WS9]|uniref:McrB family protein n=1 Tax=Ramlibacter sp. WS9 TaxID=1882741 RepID=UPI001142F161|nr:AAA family ATPase [Ramlibacter sp. WS9]ROZ78774.1 AAA family ATPase [Ramlibacter sp. WS9]